MKQNYNFNNIGKIMSACFEKNIKIYPVVYDRLHLQIEIDFSGRKKRGKEVYNWKTEQKELQEKIQELYNEIYTRIQNR